MSKTLIIAEKYSVAKEIARVVGATNKVVEAKDARYGYYDGSKYVGMLCGKSSARESAGIESRTVRTAEGSDAGVQLRFASRQEPGVSPNSRRNVFAR